VTLQCTCHKTATVSVSNKTNNTKTYLDIITDVKQWGNEIIFKTHVSLCQSSSLKSISKCQEGNKWQDTLHEAKFTLKVPTLKPCDSGLMISSQQVLWNDPVGLGFELLNVQVYCGVGKVV